MSPQGVVVIVIVAIMMLAFLTYALVNRFAGAA
jgi:hypothetical protein